MKDDLNIPTFLQRSETEAQAEARRKKNAPRDTTGGLKVKKLPEPVDPKIAKAIAKDLKESPPTAEIVKKPGKSRGPKETALRAAREEKTKAPKKAGSLVAKALKERDELHAKAKAGKSAKPAASAKKPKAKSANGGGKKDTVIALIKKGATMAELEKATKWTAHSVRAVISSVLRGKLKMKVIATRNKDGVYVYSTK